MCDAERKASFTQGRRTVRGARAAKNRTGAPSGFLFAFHSTVTNTASVDEDTVYTPFSGDSTLGTPFS